MLNIPDDKLPKEWKDEARLDSLFSPFRSRTVNPKDWDTKICSWKQLIYLYCINSGVYSFSLGSLNKLFVRNGRPPSCLSVVVEELVKNGDVQHLEVFLKRCPQTWSGWATDLLIKKPISWSFNTIKRSLFTSNVNPENIYVHLEVIREESQKLLAAVPEKQRNKLISLSEFLTLTGKDPSHAEDVKLLLHCLFIEQKVDVTNLKTCGNESESFLIKVGHNKVTPISEVDVGVYVLEQNEKLFTKDVEELEDEITLCLKQVKSHLLKGHRQLAKTCLKKKHEIEKRLTRKINALHNIQVLLERIRDVHTDADVWQSYKHALSAFNTTFKETGLTEDAVEDTMLKLAEMLDMHEEIQGAIAKPVLEDDGDLEEELAELMKTDETAEANKTESTDDLDEQLAKLDLNSLPDIPSSDVSLKEMSIS
ncbi:charged multivesicular body protein 7 [Asbolus verrucosus]|uniref:Charged multivesicular body protein 7 n=1 Tax=Asbolus verrucosus TaxID=1661398 RepID=A0A482VSM9_ASBVE|nr:charged multivesicular body protein 7 [Asbolus verrucosus]